jgi:hypothetical protein
MNRVRVIALLMACAAALALAAVASAGSVPPIKSFKLPGNKVQCVITGGSAQQAGVLCVADLNPGARPFPRANCHGEGDTGGGLRLGLTGGVKGICLSENPFVPPIRLLRYGRTITVGGISCTAISKSVGVRCENANARGFQVSPSGWKAVATTEG